MSNDNRNMILAIVLSALVLLGWSLLSNTFAPAPPPTSSATNQAAPAGQGNANAQGAAAQPQPAATRLVYNRDRLLAATAGRRVRIETPLLRGSLNLAGARIDDLLLLRHREGLSRSTPPVRLFSPADTPGAYYASFGWSGPQELLPAPETLWEVVDCAEAARIPAQGGQGCDLTKVVLTPTTPVTLQYDTSRPVDGRPANPHRLVYRIVLRVDDGYLFTAEQSVLNRGPAVQLGAVARINRVGTGPDHDSWQSQVGPVGVFNGSANYDTDYTTLNDAPNHRVEHQSRGGWLGFTDKYWLGAVIPSQQADVTADFARIGDNEYQAGFSTRPQDVERDRRLPATVYLFAGAKEISLLNRYTDSLGTDLGRAIDWGWFDFIMKPIFALLTWLFALIGNFGVAIICLTIIVRLLLFPLAQKQFSSMAKMKILQPKMKVLQERYKEDKPRLQQEMMKMYKEEQVNPMAGCLPIFLQIPVFYALYKVLMISVEMRHQPFTLWIHDLTAPDPVTPINLFGLLPFTPPGMLLIGVLPIMVGVTMWLQQKMNTAPMDPMQQKIFAWMPWILVVIMAPFAAGFQVYWVTNNLISILQIWFLNRKLGVTGPSPAAALARAGPDSPPPPPPAPRPARTRPLTPPTKGRRPRKK